MYKKSQTHKFKHTKLTSSAGPSGVLLHKALHRSRRAVGVHVLVYSGGENKMSLNLMVLMV